MKPAVRRRLIQIGLLIVFQFALLFASAGRLDWGAGWAYVILYIAFIGYNAALLLPRGSEELMEERSKVGEGAKWWDRYIIGMLTALSGPAILVVAGLDERFGWSSNLTNGIQFGSGLIVALGYLLFGWAMASNKFFSTVVRIQKDRGHTVQTGGPYRFVRHPAYAGMIAFSIAMPFMLDSLWALIPAFILIVVVIIRTLLEDRTLQAELEGYKEYTAKVRYRLVPGIW
ncbi:MAG: isoprenylcysteine carboxylmethyltransferase family protein [Chloroflexi bacterium]|nr:isoprenylcysteine carboxylmethyltransferase family protein [Chloroflexota bacterium]